MGKKLKIHLVAPPPLEKMSSYTTHCAHVIIIYDLPEDNHRKDSRHVPIRLTLYLIIVLYLIRCVQQFYYTVAKFQVHKSHLLQRPTADVNAYFIITYT